MSVKAAAVSGALQVGRKLTLDFTGPFRTENPATFSDFRLSVTFTHAETGRVVTAPGYFAADGESRDSSATAGDVWRAHFCPPEAGPWSYVARFRQGSGVAVSLEPEAGGSAGYIDGAHGKFPVATEASRKSKRGQPDAAERDAGWRAEGDEIVFVRDPGGADGSSLSFTAAEEALEGVLASGDFDNTVDVGRYAAYARHWNPSDPTWAGGRGKAVIGAVNAIAARGAARLRISVDSGGGAAKAAPWARTDLILGPGRDLDSSAQRVFDVSKLDQWETVLAHMTAKGLELRLLLADGDAGARRMTALGETMLFERKLFLRELAARFGHHPNLLWQLDRSLADDHATLDALAGFMRDSDGRGADVETCDLAEETLRARHEERRATSRSLLTSEPRPAFASFDRRERRRDGDPTLNGSAAKPAPQDGASGGFSLPADDFPSSWTGRREADPSVKARAAAICEKISTDPGEPMLDASRSFATKPVAAPRAGARRPAAERSGTSVFDLSKYNDAPKPEPVVAQRSGRVDLGLYLITTQGDASDIAPLQPNARLDRSVFSNAETAIAVEARGAEAVRARSARITLDDGAATLVSEFAPFAVFSHADGEIFDQELSWGAHRLTIEAFDGPNGRGELIARHVQSFVVYGHAPAREVEAPNVEGARDAPTLGPARAPESVSPKPVAPKSVAPKPVSPKSVSPMPAAPAIGAPTPPVAAEAGAASQKELVIRAMGDAMRRRRSRSRGMRADQAVFGGVQPTVPAMGAAEMGGAEVGAAEPARTGAEAEQRRPNEMRRADRDTSNDPLSSYRLRGMETVRFGGDAPEARPEQRSASGAREAAIAAATTDEALMSLLLVDLENGDGLGPIGGAEPDPSPQPSRPVNEPVTIDAEEAFDALFNSRRGQGGRPRGGKLNA